MDTLLHGKIGYILSKELISNGYSCINTKSFVYGNILPDLNLKYRMTMHSKSEDWNLVLKIIGDVAYGRERNVNISKKLGIVSHYLCDFFTFPHNNQFKKNIICHELYEQSQRFLLWNKLLEIWNACSKEIQIELKSIRDIKNYIEDMHSIYVRNIGDKKRDIIFSNILIRVVCSSILDIRKEQENIKVDDSIVKGFEVSII